MTAKLHALGMVDLEAIQTDYVVTRTGACWRRMRPGEVELLSQAQAIEVFRDEVVAAVEQPSELTAHVLIRDALRRYDRTTGRTKGRRVDRGVTVNRP